MSDDDGDLFSDSDDTAELIANKPEPKKVTDEGKGKKIPDPDADDDDGGEGLLESDDEGGKQTKGKQEEVNTTTASLVNLLVGSSSRDLAPLIVQYLRLADIQRLSVCCQDLKDLSTRQFKIATWLKELEVLRCLDCPLPIQKKILNRIFLIF